MSSNHTTTIPTQAPIAPTGNLLASGITLQAIGLTLGGGLCVSTLTVLAFGIAVILRHKFVAPRCSTRHPNTIWRSRSECYAESKKKRESRQQQPNDTNENTNDNTNANDANDNSNNELYAHPQDRGNPFFGWIPWTLHLSYDRMLRGIPGTGTRDRGMGGKLLAVNLDAIILFRFHALCLRVTAVVCFICIGIILPLNLTASSDHETKLTNYGQTTIANIVHQLEASSTSNNDSYLDTFLSIFATDQSLPHLIRLYVISFCTWYITYFTLKNIKRDWGENLVLRRVYYLEADHYGNRTSELNGTVYRPVAGEDDAEFDDEEDDEDNEGLQKRRRRNTGDWRSDRDPWLPHPEHRETTPNIELYSVLVGGMPFLPDEVMNSKDMQTALGFSKRQSIDWQLAVATTFFDHCVPNQPGFSSSVVAVTILPGAPELAKAWRKWYAAARSLRRLRFIRQVIQDKRYYAIDDVDEESGVVSSNAPTTARGATQSEFFLESQPQSESKVTFVDHDHESHVETRHHPESHYNREAADPSITAPPPNHTTEADYQIFESLNYGPEQQAVYSREMAQGAAACCPYGCCEGRVKRQPIDRLYEMEDATITRLKNANDALQFAQMQAAVSIADGGDKGTGRKRHKKEVIPVIATSAIDVHSTPNRSSTETGMLNSIMGRELVLSPNDFESSNSIFRESDKNSFPNDTTTGRHHGPPIPRAKIERLHSSTQQFEEVDPPSIVNGSVGIETTEDGQEDGEDGISALRSDYVIQGSVGSLNGSLLPQGNFYESTSKRTIPRMSSEGRFMFNSLGIDEEEVLLQSSEKPSLRRRANTAVSEGDQSRSSTQWNQVNTILRTGDVDDHDEISSNRKKREIGSGVWRRPSMTSFMSAVKSDILGSLRAVGKWTKGKTDPLTSTLAKDSTYAVVTFSSRQAAVAARHCLADGRGVQRWLAVETVPVPPLADAAPCDIITCRGCCRPVTLNMNRNRLMLRRYIALASLAFIYIFYTIPISAAQRFVAPDYIGKTFPAFEEWIKETPWLSAELMSGLVTALLYTLFFALCPIMFKAIANSGSQATSVQEAEKYALQYYWYFMLVTAFVFTGLADAATKIWNDSGVETSIEQLVEDIAAMTPLTTAATWLNWIIVRTTMTLPLHYLLGMNTFVFDWIGWRCCSRCVIGGGPGGPIPFRIYVDGGVVFLCVVALAPQSPIVAPVALLYYLLCVPLWRRNCIFVYRPKFDAGGENWPFLSDVLITSIFMGQFLLTLQMVLKDAFGPALIAAFPAVPTFLYRNYLIKRFRRAFDDAGLLQTSLLDGWDNSIPTSVEKREEFRQFLVDAHKASYIPVCIAGGATNILTAEPAVVIPSEGDDMIHYADVPSAPSADLSGFSPQPYSADQVHTSPPANGRLSDSHGVNPSTMSNQPGACMRRAMSFSAGTPRSASIPMMT